MKKFSDYLRILYFCAFLLASIQAHPQAPPWSSATHVSGTMGEFATATTTDANGNTYVTGCFQSPQLIFGSDILVNTSFQNFFIVKYDTSGTPVWARAANGDTDITPVAITTDLNGSVLVTGYFNNLGLALYFDTVMFCSMLNIGASELFTVKYDAAGNVQWGQFGQGFNNDYPNSIATDSLGNVIICGYSDSETLTLGSTTVANPPGLTYDFGMFMVKYTSAGILQWATAGDGTAPSLAYGICADPSGNILITGGFVDTLTLGGVSLIANPSGFFLAKCDASGNVLWMQGGYGNADSYHSLEGYAVKCDGAGNIYITGHFSTDTLFLGGVTMINTTPAYQDIFLAKLDNNGNVLWARSDGGDWNDMGNGLLLSGNGDVYLSGNYCSNNLNFGTGTLPHAGTGFTHDLFITKFDSLGQALWTLQAGGTEPDWITGITSSAMGELFVTGIFDSPVLTLGSFSLNNAGGSDGFFAVLGACSVSFTLQPDTIPLHWLALYTPSGTPPFSYTWSWGDGSASTGANASHIYAAPGFYNICLTLSDATGCSSTYCNNSTYINRNETSMITVTAVNSLTGLGEDPGSGFLVVYPQPAYDNVTVRSAHQVRNVILTNSLGKSILETQPASREFALNISRFSPGIYFLQIETPDEVSIFKIIKGE